MKILAWIGGVILTLVVALYMVLFTSLGNGVLAPIIEKKIQEATKLESKLKTFSLSMSDFELLLDLTPNNSVHIKGNYALFSQSFDVAYRVKLEELGRLSALATVPIQGAFFTEGRVVGDMQQISVDGKSDVAKSSTTYQVELRDFTPTSIIAKVEHLSLEELLFMGVQKEFAKASVWLDLNFRDITPKKLDGEVTLRTKEGSINTALMQKDFNLSLPHTTFSMGLDAKLRGEQVEYSYALSSNLAKISSKGLLTPAPLAMDLKYGVDVQELALLQPITKADIRGSLKLDGSIKGDKSALVVDGRSDIAASQTTFEAHLKEFAPASLKAKIKNLDLAKLFFMLKQPSYTEGKFSADINIEDANVASLKGIVVTNLQNGLLNAPLITKIGGFKSHMPKTTYSATTITKIEQGIADTKLGFVSNLAHLDIKSAKFWIKEGKVESDYLLKLPDLQELFFVTDQKLRGAIAVSGSFKKEKDLYFDAHSKIADGEMNAQLVNDDFKATLSEINTLKLLHMGYYPEIFEAKLAADVLYNLVAKRGTFDGKLSNGLFMQNQLLDLVKKYAKIDMYKERFSGDINAKIEQENITTSLDLASNTSSIRTKDAKLNTQSKQVDAKVVMTANTYPLSATIKGSVNSPSVGIDFKDLLKSKTGDAIKKEASKLIEKELKKEGNKKIEQEAQNLLKKLF